MEHGGTRFDSPGWVLLLGTAHRGDRDKNVGSQGPQVGHLAVGSLSDVWGRQLTWVRQLIAAILMSGLARYNLDSPCSDYGKKPTERSL
jgi:hypothetical protein